MLSFPLRFDKAQIGISGGESGKVASLPRCAGVFHIRAEWGVTVIGKAGLRAPSVVVWRADRGTFAGRECAGWQGDKEAVTRRQLGVRKAWAGAAFIGVLISRLSIRLGVVGGLLSYSNAAWAR